MENLKEPIKFIRDPLSSIDDLFERAGGSIKIAALLNMNQWSVNRWVNIGIPLKYWPDIIVKFGVNEVELYAVSQKAKKLARQKNEEKKSKK